MTKNAMGYDDSLFTDHDPLIGVDNYNPTKAVDAITHDVEMPKPKYANLAHQKQMNALASKIADSDEPLTYRPKPGESRKDYRMRIQAQSQAVRIREFRNRTYDKPFLDNEPTWVQKRINSALISLRKKLRKAGLRDSKTYRYTSEQWWRNFNRIGGYKSKVQYRTVGEVMHKHEETKLQRQLDSWR